MSRFDFRRPKGESVRAVNQNVFDRLGVEKRCIEVSSDWLRTRKIIETVVYPQGHEVE